MARVKLTFNMATEVVGNKEGGLLIVTDQDETRQVAIPCDERTLSTFVHRLGNMGTDEQDLADVMVKILEWQTELDLEIVIDNVKNGRYHAIISNRATLAQLPLRGEDAVLLNFISDDKIPLYMEQYLFEKQSSEFNANARGISLPVNAISDEMLKEALRKAIADENYELASKINEEVKWRGLDLNDASAPDDREE